MKKDEFLQLLRRALTGDVPPGVVEENIKYYDNYIMEEVRNGTKEEDVIADIGDPRLIAKTIEDTTEGAGEQGYTDASDNESSQTHQQNPYGSPGGIHTFQLNKWYWKLLVIVTIFMVISLVVTIVGGIFSFVLPLLGPLMMIWAIMWIFKMFHRR